MNRQLADFSLSKGHPHPHQDQLNASKYSRHQDDFDDSRSVQSSVHPASNLNESSRFESAVKNPQLLNQTHQSMANQQTPASRMGDGSLSQISFEEAFPSAEQNAFAQEELARRKREEKEWKLREFQRQTKEKAQKKLKEDQATKERAEQDKFLQEKERLVKARDYAQRQREIMKSKNQKKTSQSSVEVLEQWNSDPAGEHTAFHQEFLHASKDLRQAIDEQVIQEAPECEEKDKSSLVVERDPAEDNLREMYQRIDQEEMQKLGLGSKKELEKEAIGYLHEYSMLQRFRQEKDLKAFDDYKPPRIDTQSDKENWWQGNEQRGKGPSEAQKKKAVEKQRYQEALKAIYNDQERLKVGEIIYK